MIDREVASKRKLCCYAKERNPPVFESQLSTLPVLQLTSEFQGISLTC